MKLFPFFFLSLFFLLTLTLRGLSQEGTVLAADTSHRISPEKEKTGLDKFNPGEMIIEHVVDNHDWHIFTLGHLHVTIPLPVILLYDGQLFTFWSAKFHNTYH